MVIPGEEFEDAFYGNNGSLLKQIVIYKFIKKKQMLLMLEQILVMIKIEMADLFTGEGSNCW